MNRFKNGMSANLTLERVDSGYYKFERLNNTVWEIKNTEVQMYSRGSSDYRKCQILENSMNFTNFTKLKLATYDNSVMVWIDIDKTTNVETPHYEDLTVQFINSFTREQETAIILRPATNFQPGVHNNDIYEATKGPSFNNNEDDVDMVDSEVLLVDGTISGIHSEFVPTKLTVINNFYDDSNHICEVTMELSPAQ